MTLKDEKVTCIACGSGDAQTLCSVASGGVYSWGDGDYGKLGRGGNEGTCIIAIPLKHKHSNGTLSIDDVGH